MTAGPTHLEAVLRRDRVVILAGLAAVVVLSWAYLVHLVREMETTEGMAAGMAMPHMQSWGAVELLLLCVMWTVMMVAMMVPSVAPLVLMFAAARRRQGAGRVVGSAGLLLLGYLVVWTGFSGLAALVQWRLHAAALLSPMMTSNSPLLGGALLVAAGIFQLTPLKRACLGHCRTPMGFLMAHWREGRWGSVRMGLEHGAYCLGCCWLLMALLFVAGVMNLLWVAALAALVLVEKLAPRGELVGRVVGIALIVAGMASMLSRLPL